MIVKVIVWSEKVSFIDFGLYTPKSVINTYKSRFNFIIQNYADLVCKFKT